MRSLLRSGAVRPAGAALAVAALLGGGVLVLTGSDEAAPAAAAPAAVAPVTSERLAEPVSEAEPLPFDGWADGYPSHAVTSRVPTLTVHASPAGPVAHELAQTRPTGAPLTLLLLDVEGDWLQVNLPVRPNASTGWVRRDEVEVAAVRHRVDVSLSRHELRLYDLDTLVETYPVGIGTEASPTPGGVFSVTELIEPTNPDGLYGPYAFGLTGFSETLTEYAGGEAAIGIHGTDEPDSVGRDTSHGCIRLRNEDVTELAGLLPLGTPVRILR